MNGIPENELKSFHQIEAHFDTAYITLLDKLGQLSQEPTTEEEEQTTETNDQDEGSSNEHDEESNGDLSSEIQDKWQEEEQSQQLQEDIAEAAQPELVQLALCFAKLMTKSLLAVERTASLETRLCALERENCTLRAIASNIPELNRSPDKEKGQESSNHKSKSKVVNLIAFKEAIEHEIDSLIEQQNKSMQQLERKYKNHIFGLTLAVDYLNKELSGRVQQLQIYDRLLVEGDVNSAKMVQLEHIWNQLVGEISLNRYKTIVRLADTAMQERDQSDQSSSEWSDMDNLCSFLVNGCQLTGPKLVDISKLGQVQFVTFYTEKDQTVGLWINGGNERHMPLWIQRVDANSATGKTGQLRPGDIILSVQNFDMIGATQEYVAQLLKSISGPCRLGIVRIPVNDLTQCLSNQDNFELLYDDFTTEQDQDQDQLASSSCPSESESECSS